MNKRRITYVVDVDFPDRVPEITIQLWADGIARGIEHSRPEVKTVEVTVQVRDFDTERTPLDPHPFYPQAAKPLPPADPED